MTDGAAIEVRDNPSANRYEAWLDGSLAAFSQYIPHADRVTFTHTETQPGFEGKGVGSALAHDALADVRRQGKKVEPWCPFIRAYLERHPDEADVFA